MRRIIVLFLTAFILSTAAYAAVEKVPEFKVIYHNVCLGQENAKSCDVIVFEFNLRIDHVGISATLNGCTDNIQKLLLTDGKRLEIQLKEPLSTENGYVVELLGIKEIYSSTSLAKTKFTLKMNELFVLEKEINAESKSYYSLVKNNLSNDKTATFVVVAKERQSGSLLDIKIITKNVPANGGETGFSHTFSNLTKECDISGYGFYNIRELIPIGN